MSTSCLRRVVNVLRTNVNCLPELADYPLVGHELNPATGTGHTAPLPKDGTFPPSIVGRVCAIEPTLLPPPSEVDTWRALVKGPDAQGAPTIFTVGAQAVKLGLKLAGSVLPIKLFQPAYNIDAETQILRPLARRLGLLLSGSFDEGIVLRDRCAAESCLEVLKRDCASAQPLRATHNRWLAGSGRGIGWHCMKISEQ